MSKFRTLFTAFIVFLAIQVAQAEAKKPNIVFFFSDDLTTQAISAYKYGMDLPPTPNIDRLAREGMLFENSFCCNSICTPSRGAVMTGLHSHKNGIVHLGGALDPDRPTWPKALHQNGYTTAVFGKWHMKTKPRGFDTWEVFSGQGNYYNPELFGSQGGSRVIQGHSTDIVTDLALDWLDSRDKSKPFALLVQHKAPHRNWKPSIQELQRYRDITFPEPPTLFDSYAGRVAAANHKMGIDEHMRMGSDLMMFSGDEDKKVLSRLTPAQHKAYLAAFAEEDAAFRANPPTGKELVRWKYQRYMRNYLRCVAGLNLTDETVVVYSADQGFYLGEHGWFDKRWAYEESMRMPLIVRWPGKVKAGSRCAAMVQNIDYAPTFLAMAGLEPDWQVHGVSLMPLLTGGGATPADWRYYRYIDGGHGVAQHSAIRTNEYKLLYFDHPRNDAEEQSRWELYDVKKDPQDMTNLAFFPQHQSQLAAMKDRFWKTRTFYDDTDESVWQRGATKRYRPEDYIRQRR